MKIAIVGGSGFIGTRRCDRLIKNKEIQKSYIASKKHVFNFMIRYCFDKKKISDIHKYPTKNTKEIIPKLA